MRGGVMHGKLWSKRAYSGGPSFGTGTTLTYVASSVNSSFTRFLPILDDEKRSMLLIMRVLSIVPLAFKVSQPADCMGMISR